MVVVVLAVLISCSSSASSSRISLTPCSSQNLWSLVLEVVILGLLVGNSLVFLGDFCSAVPSFSGF